MRVNYAIVFVSDMPRSVGFYRDTLGLPLRYESPAWTEFATDGATLALHLGERGTPPDGLSRNPSAGHCVPGLNVADLDAFHLRMVEQNVRCLQEPKEEFGARIAQYADPDGLVFTVGEEADKAH